MTEQMKNTGGEPVNPVEFCLIKEDNTWYTKVILVPASIGLKREDLISWAETELIRQSQYRKVVMFTVYHIPSDDGCEVGDFKASPQAD